MKDLHQIITEYALRAISDDYEDFERVLKDVSGWTAERGITVDRQAVVKALEGLISDGCAQAYLLSAKAEPVDYSADRVDEVWFYVTSKGKELAGQFREKWR